MKTKRQKTLGSFWDVKAQPPVPLLQRALETSSKAASRRVSQKLQECRQKGETLVVLTEEELALAVEEKARLRGTPGRPATLPALQQQQQGSLVVGLQKKRPGATGARVEETAAIKAAMAKELADMAAACASPQELQREAVKAFKALGKFEESSGWTFSLGDTSEGTAARPTTEHKKERSESVFEERQHEAQPGLQKTWRRQKGQLP